MSTVHGGKWRVRDGHERCEYCGSLTPAEALRRMTTPGCGFSGTDKGAYKFYFTSETGDHGKFYGEHLADLDAAQLEEWAKASRRCLGFDWIHQAGKQPLNSRPKSGSFYGWQTWGKIGPDGQPIFDDGAPTPPDEEWWAQQRAGHLASADTSKREGHNG